MKGGLHPFSLGVSNISASTGMDASCGDAVSTSSVTPATGAEGRGTTSSGATMTYANLETLTRIEPEDLHSILTGGQHHHHHHHQSVGQEGPQTAHYADDSNANEDGGVVVVEGDSIAEAFHHQQQDAYVDGPNTTGDDTGEATHESVSVHSYCKQPTGSVETANNKTHQQTDSGRAAELLDLKTVLPGPTTRRVLLIDDGHGDLEMAKSDVEFLLRGDAAGIVLREGKRSEVWSRFGKVTFQGRKVKGYVACIYCRQVLNVSS